MNNGHYYGKYRGMVLNNIDPLQQGRLQVQVPDVAGLIPTSWAMPCVPVAGIQNGMFALPIVGSGVWVEFEQGDPDYPIWVGCFWGSANMPFWMPARGTQGIAQLVGISPATSGTCTCSRPCCSGSMLFSTMPRYLP